MTTKTASLSGIECTNSKIINRNTFEYIRPDGTYVIRLHMTDILEKRPTGEYVIYTGGWRTPTTKDRLNEHLPAGLRIYQDRGVWYLKGRDYETEVTEGMVIPADGSQPRRTREQYNQERTAQKHKRLLDAYMKVFKKHLEEHGVPQPSGGDCWLCSMFDYGRLRDGIKMDPKHDRGHIVTHLKDKYVHGSLVMNALLWAGYKESQMPFVWGAKDIAIRCVRRYLKFRLGMAG